MIVSTLTGGGEPAPADAEHDMARQQRDRVVILGGGFAGLACARALPARDFAVVLVDRRDRFEFLPNIHELVSGVKTPASLQLALKPLLRRQGHRFRRGTVLSIDRDARRVLLEGGGSVVYDRLVLAIGGVDATYGVTGVARHALPFKSIAQCARIGAALRALASRTGIGRVVIVGGGLEGVEALGEILRRYRDSGMQVTLLEARERLLPEAPAVLDAQLRTLCAGLPVEFRCKAAVRRINARSVTLRDGERLPSDLTIWTGGPAPPPLLANSGLSDGGWAPVDACLRSTVDPAIHIAGDAAAPPEPLPRQAYHGLDMGRCVAQNLQRERRGRTPGPFRPAPKPMLVSFGDLSCFLVAGDCVLAGPALGAGKEAIYEWVMTQLDQQALPLRALRGAVRGRLAARELLWPVLASPARWRGQSRVQWLAP
jgi:NADH dehydrogenase